MRKSKYSKEFKNSTVQLILNDKESVVKVAEDLDLNPQTLYNWVSAYRKEHNMPIRDIKTTNTSETLSEENKRLRHELKIAKQERDILKKAAAYFAKETL
jgi:transposase